MASRHRIGIHPLPIERQRKQRIHSIGRRRDAAEDISFDLRIHNPTLFFGAAALRETPTGTQKPGRSRGKDNVLFPGHSTRPHEEYDRPTAGDDSGTGPRTGKSPHRKRVRCRQAATFPPGLGLSCMVSPNRAQQTPPLGGGVCLSNARYIITENGGLPRRVSFLRSGPAPPERSVRAPPTATSARHLPYRGRADASTRPVVRIPLPCRVSGSCSAPHRIPG